MSLTFNADLHAYYFNGERVPSVTQIIEPMYDFRFVKPEVLESARILGTAVHKTVELFEKGTLDEDATPPRLIKYLDQWKAFKRDLKFDPVDMGKRMYSPTFGYAGTDDTYGVMSDHYMPVGLDIKTGQSYPAHALQTAGYKEMRVETDGAANNYRRGSIYLSETEYHLKFHDDVNDRSVFLSLLTTHKWRMKHDRSYAKRFDGSDRG